MTLAEAPASLTRDEAARRAWDVVVVGAGVAGAAAAGALARLDLAVLLVEQARPPRDKVCGCCLNGRALAHLDALGMGGLAAGEGAVPLGRFLVAAGDRRALLPLPRGAALSRARLDAALVRAAVAAGAAFLPGTRAVVGPPDDESRTVRLGPPEAGAAVRGRVVLLASGLARQAVEGDGAPRVRVTPGSRLGAAAVLAEPAGGLLAHYEPGTIFMACARGGYAGLVRLEDGRLNVAAALDPGVLRQAGGPAAAVAGILQGTEWPVPPHLADAAWKGTPPLTWRVTPPAGPRLFLIGDAAGYVEPFTGEGMAWALASARAVLPLVARACRRWQPGLVRQWTMRHREAVGRTQTVSRTVARLLRHPLLMRSLVRGLGAAPSLAHPVLAYLNC